MKLCVFPNDPIVSYFKKGEIKNRYYNPCNVFEKLDIISFTDKDIEESKVKKLAGNAELKIHCVGKINLINKSKKKKEVLQLLKQINPDIVRSYNALLEGWVAAYCSEKLNIPFFVSLHVQYDKKRELIKSQNFKKYFALKYYKKSIEPYTLKQADKITIVYKIIEPYVKEISGKTPEVLYNRIDLKRFQNAKKIQTFDKPLILSVGRLTPRKNHECIIKAIKNLDVYLQIIGDGESYDSLVQLSKDLNIKNKIIFKKSVPNDEIQNYYKSADLFVLVYNSEVEGLPIPVLEAMATGLPIIISAPVKNLSDGLENSVEFSKIDPETLCTKIKKLLNDKEYSKKLANAALKKSFEFDGKNTEQRESEIYEELLSSKRLA